MVYLAGIGFRFIELGLLAALLVSAGLLFVRRRPAVLLFWGLLVVSALAVHLFVERDRWQMLPAYALLFVLAVWLCLPSRRAYRWAGGILRVAVVVLLVLPAVALPIAVPLFSLSAPGGPEVVGSAVLYPVQTGAPQRVTIWYPTDEPTELVAPFWRPEEIRRWKLPGIHPLFTSHFALVPTPAYVRAEIKGESLPLLLVAPGPQGLPGDQLSLVLAAASSGWFVAQVPPGTAPVAVVELVELLTVRARDAAIAGRVDPNRVALLTYASAPAPDLGFAALHVGDATVVSVHTSGAGARLSFPDRVVPDRALTERHRFTLLPSLLTGSSDIPPARAHAAVTRFASQILSDGSLNAPIFGGRIPDASVLLGDQPEGAVNYLRSQTER